MKLLHIICFFVLSFGWIKKSYGQIKLLTIEDCYVLSQQNYPKIKEQDLIKQSTQYAIDNVNKRYLPQLSINGQATYQSDVTHLPFSMPGVNITPLDREQYKIQGEVNQPLTDLFTIKQHKDLVEINGAMEEQKLAIELYALKEKINQFYFGVLLIDAQLKQLDVLKNELQNTINQLSSAVLNGVSLPSNVDLLTVEKIKTDQKSIELRASKKAFLQMLGLFIDQQIDENTVFSMPAENASSFEINRPELTLLNTQKTALNIKNKLITVKNLPRLGLFFRGGYGRPGLNFLSNEFDTYYLTGLQLNWSLTGFYTMKKEKKILSVNQQMVDVQKETFEFNINQAVVQQNNELEKIRKLIDGDREIIELHQKVLKASRSQLANGTITTTTYLSALNGLDQAKLNEALHKLQLLLAQSKLQLTLGN